MSTRNHHEQTKHLFPSTIGHITKLSAKTAARGEKNRKRRSDGPHAETSLCMCRTGGYSPKALDSFHHYMFRTFYYMFSFSCSSPLGTRSYGHGTRQGKVELATSMFHYVFPAVHQCRINHVEKMKQNGPNTYQVSYTHHIKISPLKKEWD